MKCPHIVLSKELEGIEGRKVYQKEKLSLKDEMVITLLPKAFSKFTRIYAYIDTKNHWLILNTTNTKKSTQFISLFKKAITEDIQASEIKKLSPIITNWLKNQTYPTSFSIEKSCVLQDPDQQNRIIRCQQQDLFASSIQTLIKEGCEAKQLAFCWQDRVYFTLTADNFWLHGIRYQEEITSQAKEIEAESKQQQFIADFFIMTETLAALLKELVNLFSAALSNIDSSKVIPMVKIA